jgi:hypothetical protein
MHVSTGAPPCEEAGSGAVRHTVTPEPTVEARRGPESWHAWQHRNPPVLGAVSRAVGHAATPEPT